MKSQRLNIKDVARIAGVSTQTISRVLNDRPDVAPETRQRVQQIIEELGYQPSALARSLIRQRSKTIGVVTAGLKYMGPSRTLNGITSKTEELGYALLLKELPGFQSDQIAPIFQALTARQVEGIIWAVPQIGSNHQWLEVVSQTSDVPIVFLTMPAREDLCVISVDNYLGGKLATNHLIQQGYRHIGHLSGPLDWWEAQQRKQAWEDALLEAGRPVPPQAWAEGNWSSASGFQAIQVLFLQYPKMDAVFVANDQMALSVLLYAQKNQIAVPGQLGVIGFDGMDESPYFTPPLTTVYQDLHALGTAAVTELLEMVERVNQGKPIQPKHLFAEPKLLVRHSS